MEELTKEQQYWSLNGSFEALARMMSDLTTGKIKSPIDLHKILLSNMEQVNKQMNELESVLNKTVN